ncbi:hypothetical protein Tco_0518495, partial [Tanacetum coccineum]
MPPRRSSATARDASTTVRAAAIAAATPMTAAAVDTNGHGDESHNSETGIKGTVRTP